MVVHDFLVIQLGLFDHKTMGLKIVDITDARGIQYDCFCMGISWVVLVITSKFHMNKATNQSKTTPHS